MPISQESGARCKGGAPMKTGLAVVSKRTPTEKLALAVELPEALEVSEFDRPIPEHLVFRVDGLDPREVQKCILWFVPLSSARPAARQSPSARGWRGCRGCRSRPVVARPSGST